MWKRALAGTAALAIVGCSFVYAQQSNGPAGSDVQRHWRPSAQDMAAFTDARVAAMKAGLMLTPDQEKNWPAFEQAYRDLAKMRAERRARREQSAGNQRTDDANPIDRLERRADAITARGTAIKHLADAAGPLYQSLDDGQKHRFLLLSRLMHARDHERFARMHREHDEER
ncbi:MAG: Spy/CpxP family protein refolding chaperone [Xanthobacteraceae bacterium]